MIARKPLPRKRNDEIIVRTILTQPWVQQNNHRKQLYTMTTHSRASISSQPACAHPLLNTKQTRTLSTKASASSNAPRTPSKAIETSRPFSCAFSSFSITTPAPPTPGSPPGAAIGPIASAAATAAAAASAVAPLLLLTAASVAVSSRRRKHAQYASNT